MIASVSVIMPAFNSERFVEQAINSICTQTLNDFEFIIVDDGSTDTTPQILHDAARRDSRIRVISRPNTGIVGALNDGVAAARGAFIARMDADDISAPERIQCQVEAMKNSHDLVALGTGWRYLNECGSLGRRYHTVDSHERIERLLLLGESYAILHPTAMMRRDAVLSVGGYRQHFRNYHEELDLYLRLARVGRLSNVRRCLFEYRQHGTSSVAMAKHALGKDSAKESILREAYEVRQMTYPPDWRTEWLQADPIGTRLRDGWSLLRARRRWRAAAEACRVIGSHPWESRAWRLFACSVRGH